MISRRKMLRMLAEMPLIGGLASTGLLGTTGCSVEKNSPSRNLFEEVGVETVINGRGTVTFLSGSVMRPEVLEAINSTAREFANLSDVQDKVGARIARMLNCEAAMVTSGAASALTLGTAAAITGDNEELIRQLPNIQGPRPEVIIQKRHRYSYDHAVRNTGAKMVEVEGAREMEQAVNKNTVMALFFNAAAQFGGFENKIKHEEFVAIARRHGIPAFIDAAADVPPKENLFKYKDMGFDLVTFSGGKAIRGPQSAGLLFGRKDLIEAAKLNHVPHSDTIGRGLKVNKEEIFGMMVALESYLERDHEQEWQDWLERAGQIVSSANAVQGVKAEIFINPGPANHFPRVRITWDQNQVKVSPDEVVEALRNGNPAIATRTVGKGEILSISIAMMQPRHVDIVARRVKEVLEHAV